MKYNFDKIIDRRNTSSVKWDCNEQVFGSKDILPMWVADMDFESPSEVIEAIKKRAEHGIYGYTERPESMYKSVISWMEKRHGFKTEKDWYLFTPGIVTAINIAVMTYTKPGDKIIIQSPVYYPFSSAVTNNGRQVVSNDLKLQDGKYIMNYEDLENKIDSRTRMLILCSPHNPVGRVWTREELKKLGDICIKHNIIIVSDEIHSDLIYSKHKHIPMASISDEIAQNTITCIAPSKTFNVAGLETSAIIIPNSKLRDRFQISLDNIGLGMTNIFGIAAFEAAYSYGEEWLDELLKYLEGNVDYLIGFIEKKLPEIKVIRPDGTYLVWLDMRGLNMNADELKVFMVESAHLGLDDGYMFGEAGERFERVNIACPRSILEDGLNRLEKAIKILK